MRVFDSATAEKNPAMNLSVPPIAEKDRDWRLQQKPCDDLGDVFLPEGDFFDGADETEYEREQTREHNRYITDQCRKNCPFLGLCSREAILSAQMLARMQGSPARLYGVWGGIIFRGREGRPQYQNKLDQLYDQMHHGEITWEQSNSNPTSQPSPSESRPSARDTSGPNSAMTIMSAPAGSTSGSLPARTGTECSLTR